MAFGTCRFSARKRSISPPAAYLRGTPRVSGLRPVAGLRLLWQDLAPARSPPLDPVRRLLGCRVLAPRFVLGVTERRLADRVSLGPLAYHLARWCRLRR